MKKFIILSFVLLSTLFVSASEPYACDTVIQVPGKDAHEIYDSLKKWFITNSKYDSRYIVQQDDPENKRLVGKLTFNFKVSNMTWAAASGYIDVVIDVMARDGRFKIILSNFYHTSTHPQYSAHWSLGTITEEIPEEWAKGWKTKQQRETYKRAFPRCVEIAELLLNDIAEYAKDFKTIADDDW